MFGNTCKSRHKHEVKNSKLPKGRISVHPSTAILVIGAYYQTSIIVIVIHFIAKHFGIFMHVKINEILVTLIKYNKSEEWVVKIVSSKHISSNIDKRGPMYYKLYAQEWGFCYWKIADIHFQFTQLNLLFRYSFSTFTNL